MAKVSGKYGRFFRSLGFEAVVEKEISGARGKHKIDVFVTPCIQGLQLKWVVECKCWESNVTKEKVLALLSIVYDIGADRGFLLSEKGFQSGAIQSSHNSNIVLSSLADLKLVTKVALKEEETGKIYFRRKQVSDRLWQLHKNTGHEFSEYFVQMLKLDFLDHGIDEALKGNFPVSYSSDDETPKAANWSDLMKRVNALLEETEQYAEQHEKQHFGS